MQDWSKSLPSLSGNTDKHPRLQSSRCWERPGEVTFSVWEGMGDVSATLSPHSSIASTASSGEGLLGTTAAHLHWELGLAPTTSTEIQEQRIQRQYKCRCWRLQILSHRQHYINIRTKVLQAQK